MKKLGFLLAGLLFAILLMASLGRHAAGPVDNDPVVNLVTSTAERRPAAELINSLDRKFQLRFERVDLPVFGGSRIAPEPVFAGGSAHRYFSPENHEERRLVRALTDDAWDAVFYVAGRQTLALAAAEERFLKYGGKFGPFVRVGSGEALAQHGVSKSIRLTRVKCSVPAPTPESLYPHVFKAFREFADYKTTYEFHESGWLVSAKPVPASSRECLDCHQDVRNPLKVGDTLGVAMYAFAPADERRKQPTRPETQIFAQSQSQSQSLH
jgi:hypothetical protein